MVITRNNEHLKNFCKFERTVIETGDYRVLVGTKVRNIRRSFTVTFARTALPPAHLASHSPWRKSLNV